MGDIAGRWVAVSTGGQDERDQEPRIDRWIADHGYETGPTYRLHGVSRYKGAKRHDDMLSRVIDDMRNGVISVLVVYQSSRIERRGAYNVFDLVRRVKETNGRIEYVMDTHLNATNEMSDVQLALNATMDKMSSKAKSDAVLKSHDTIRECGGLIGRPPFGFTSEPYICATHGKTHQRLIPGEWSRYVKPIFVMVAEGKTLESIAVWLDSESVPTNSKIGTEWSAKSIAQIIRNETYIGIRRNGDGNVAHECTAVIERDLFDKANKALDSTPSGRRGRPAKSNPAMLTGVICGQCGTGHMSRIYAGTGENRIAYYRCHGIGAKPKGCGAKMVRCDVLDRMVSDILSWNTKPILESRFVPGTDNKAQLAEIRGKLTRLDPFNPDHKSEYERLMAKGQELMSAGETPDRWVMVDTGETYASRWASLDNSARREFLARDVKITFKWDTVPVVKDQDGNVVSPAGIGPTVIIDAGESESL